jgi:hypothetical protein
MKSAGSGFHRTRVLLLLIIAVAPLARASIPVWNFGSSSLAIDPDTSTASYTQTTTALVLTNTFNLGDTVGGAFGSLAAPTSLDLQSYPAFGLQMSLTSATPLSAPFSFELFDTNFNPLARFTADTSMLSTNTSVLWLTPSEFSGLPFASVGGVQFTWDDTSSLNSSTLVRSLVVAQREGYFVARSPGGFRLFTSTNSTAGLRLPPGSSSWASLSDSNAKTDITALDHNETLRKVAVLPVTAWNYKHDTQRRYLGPMAQDFHRAFGLGLDDRHIATLDTDGVALSALKGLIAKLQEGKVLSAEQASRLTDLEAELRTLREQLQNGLPPAAP